MSIWERSLKLVSGRDIWLELGRSLLHPRSLESARDGIWGQISLPPGGLWRDLQEETLVLRRPQDDLWIQAADETLIIRPRLDLWQALAASLPEQRPALEHSPDATMIPGSAGLWDELDEETLLLSRARVSVWELPQVRSFAFFKPQRATGYALKKLETAAGETYWVLKNLRTDVYIRLDAQQHYLWNLLDGAHTVQDLAIANFMQFGVFSVDWLASFLGQLQTKGFLVQEKQDVYQGAQATVEKRSLWYWVRVIAARLFESEIGLPVDRFYATLYRGGAHLIFTWPVQILLFLITLAGIPAYFYITGRGEVTLVQAEAATLTTVSLLVAQILTFFLHESGHALTTKHYGRQLRRGGVGLYFGMIAFFIDTTDIWMEKRGPRLAVTWAGPYSMLILGSAVSLIMLAIPQQTTLWVLGYQFIVFCYLNALLNLNPLMKLDGYYLLMDWLEIPMLRERSIDFVRKKLWQKIKAREAWVRDEFVFAIFGALVLGWIALMIGLIVRLYGSQLLNWAAQLLA